MARAKGRDVLLDLMDSVEKLEASSRLHAEQLENLAKLAMGTSATVTALSAEVQQVWRALESLADEMGAVSQRVNSLESEVQVLSEGFSQAAVAGRTHQQQMSRFARLFVEFVDGSRSRFDLIEIRLDKLERKAG